MYAATYERHKALLEVPNVGESNSSAIKRRMIDTGSTTYRGVKRRTITALRWADIQGKLKWAAIILGHAMPDSWFDNTVTYDGPWECIQDAVALYAEDLITMVQKELAAQLSFQAPISLLRGSHDEAFLSWLDGKLEMQADIGQYGGLASVSCIAGRIAQLWHYRTDVLPAEKYSFMQLLKAQQLDIHLDWPAVGSSAVAEIEVTIAWDNDPVSREPLLTSPLDRIVRTVIPGLQFVTVLRRLCAKCNDLPEYFCEKIHLEVHSASSQVLDTLHLLEVTLQGHGKLII
jgi:hypothetical protein